MERGARTTIRFKRDDVLEIRFTRMRMGEFVEPRRRSAAHDESATAVALRTGFPI
jgi:hypothetical protein